MMDALIVTVFSVIIFVFALALGNAYNDIAAQRKRIYDLKVEVSKHALDFNVIYKRILQVEEEASKSEKGGVVR